MPCYQIKFSYFYLLVLRTCGGQGDVAELSRDPRLVVGFSETPYLQFGTYYIAASAQMYHAKNWTDCLCVLVLCTKFINHPLWDVVVLVAPFGWQCNKINNTSWRKTLLNFTQVFVPETNLLQSQVRRNTVNCY
jgi:hypothetical protein